MDELAGAAVERSSLLLLVCTPDVAAARHARRDLDLLRAAGYGDREIAVVMNRAGAPVGVACTDVERALGLDAAFHVPSSRIVPASANRGEPAVLAHPRSQVARSFQRLADRVLTSAARRAGAPTASQTTRRGRLRGRRVAPPGSRRRRFASSPA